MKTASLIRFRIDFTESSNVGPGKIDLLESIKEHGSVSEAARRMGLSYRRAWLILDSLNKSFDTRVTVNSVGGIGGGGVRVTPFGDLLVETYRKVEGQIAALGLKSLKEIKAHARDDVSEARHRVSIVKKRPRKK